MNETAQNTEASAPLDVVRNAGLPAVSGETASTAVAAQARAAVQARYQIALARPRDIDQVRVALLKECRRPGFADVARYHKPIGNGVEGFSIRFAEAAMRALGNLYPETTVVYEDPEKRIVRVSLTELEANITLSTDVVIEKVVERSSVKQGQEVISKRTNSRGATTFLVAATEDDLLNKQNALISKALRTHVLRILPGDIQDEAEELIRKTLTDRAAGDPDKERKALTDSFAALNVGPLALKEYLGHDLATTTPAELVELRKVYATVKTGEASWHDILAAKTGKAESDKASDAAKAQSSAIAEKLKQGKAKATKPASTSDASPTTSEEPAACEACGEKNGHKPSCPNGERA